MSAFKILKMKKTKTLLGIFLNLAFIFLSIEINAQTENALNFDGINDYVSLPSSTHNQIVSSGTLEAWIKTSDNNSNYRGIVLRSNHYGLFLYNNKLATYVWGGNAPGLICPVNGPTLNDGKWHHVALTFEIGVANGSQLYLDGAPLGGTFKLDTYQSAATYSFQIGANQNLQFYKGAIDEVKIWSRKLTAQEIENTTDCISNTATNLVGHYEFNVGTAGGANSGLTTLADSSGSSNNGTLNYFALYGAASNWVNGYTCQCATPTGDANQTLCAGSTLADLTATGQQIQWYENATGGTALFNSATLTNNTTYYATQTNGGCESVDRLAVTVTLNTTNAPTGNSAQNFCGQWLIDDLLAIGTDISWYDISSGGQEIQNGTSLITSTYYASQTIDGCESENRLPVNVTVTYVSNNVSLTGSTLTAAENGASYQWIDCNNNNAYISGATAQTYSPTSNGNYAAIITVNGCSETSACVAFSTLGINDLKNNSFQIHPNPASTTINIELDAISNVRLYDIDGKILREFKDASNYSIDISTLKQGVYFFETNEGLKAKFVKQ